MGGALGFAHSSAARSLDVATKAFFTHSWRRVRTRAHLRSPSSYRVLSCDIMGDVAAAQAHGREAVSYAERTGNQSARVWAYVTLGLSNSLNRTWRDALEALGTAFTIVTEHRLLMVKGYVQSAMAAHFGLGDYRHALALAEEAIAESQLRGTRLWEFSAQLIRMRALREIRGVEAQKEIKVSLAEAEAWLEMSGAKSYEPFLHVEHAELARLMGDEATRESELRYAHRLFIEIGAPIRATEVARELGL
jgi:tetratricopeptide (TPR) repeat protein